MVYGCFRALSPKAVPDQKQPSGKNKAAQVVGILYSLTFAPHHFPEALHVNIGLSPNLAGSMFHALINGLVAMWRGCLSTRPN